MLIRVRDIRAVPGPRVHSRRRLCVRRSAPEMLARFMCAWICERAGGHLCRRMPRSLTWRFVVHRCASSCQPGGSCVWPSDRQLYTSIALTERLTEAGVDPSVGSIGDAFDAALAESVIGLFKTELIKPRGPGPTVEQVEIATLEYVDWLNRRVGSSQGPGSAAGLRQSRGER